MDENSLEIIIKIPFTTARLAQIVYDVLRVDAEPKRSAIHKKLSIENNILIGKFTGTGLRQLRVGVNCFFENITLITKTFDFAGPPTTDTYSYY